jgi:hypothetical protein
MSAREWLLSVLFAAFVVLKVAEGWLALEEWPLTNVPMYARSRPAHELPRRATIHALRRGAWFEMAPFHFGLNRDELAGRILYAADVGAACGELVRAFNARRRPILRVDAAYVRTVTVARPDAPERASDERVPCPLEVPAP